MTIECAPRAFRFVIWVNVQNNPRNFPPIGAFRVSVKQPQVCHQMFVVISRQCGRGWRQVGDIWIKWRFVR